MVVLQQLTDYTAILEVYSLQDIYDYNDMTDEDVLILLHQELNVKLPEIKSLDYD